MIILGLGSNLGDRLQNLRLAYRALAKIKELTIQQVSPIYISDALLLDNSPKDWNMPYLNLAIRCETTLAPETLLKLTKEIEYALGRRPGEEWAPRPVDIDILAIDDLVQFDDLLHIPHEHLHTRPFALWPFADVAPRWVYPLTPTFQGKTATEIASQWGSRFSGEAPLHCRQILHRIDTSQFVGILNITPDAFSDGGLFQTIDAAVAQAHFLVNSGAAILDIGAESTNPRATALDAHTEWARLEPVLCAILQEKSAMLIPPKISVDTYHAEVAQKALALGVDWINDVSGLSDPAMQEIVKDSACDVVIMHQLSLPANAKNVLPLTTNPIIPVYHWAENQLNHLAKMGISPDRIIFDVGIGFGKTAEQSLELLQQIETFKALPTRLMVGHSRKSFFSFFTDKPFAERDVETLALTFPLSEKGVDYLRVHNVEMCTRGLKVSQAVKAFAEKTAATV